MRFFVEDMIRWGKLSDPNSFNKETLIEDLLAYVLNEVYELKVGEEFLLRDLFKGYIWNRLSQAQKAELGRYVTDYINNYTCVCYDEYKLFCYSRTTCQKQMIFVRIEEDDEIIKVPRKEPRTDAPKLSDFNGDKEAFEKAFAMYVAEKRDKRRSRHE